MRHQRAELTGVRWGTAVLSAIVAGALAATVTWPVPAVANLACAPGGPVVRHEGHVTSADSRTYKVLPFDVAAGTTRVEVSYGWRDDAAGPLGAPPSTPITQTVFDLGLWDADGYTTPAGFRGWSGSRQGKAHAGQPPVFVQTDAAERGYQPGPIKPGRWWADLGIASVGPTGASWWVEARCLAPVTDPAPAAQPVDPTYVARAEPGWYFGDMHMHGFHSAGNGPSWPDFVAQARAAGLDFLPVTEYVAPAHWNELGPVQAANPDLLLWPGREIITYFGHANAIGETPSVIDWRHGFDDGNGYRARLRDIQSATKADGALFQVNHPTIFPGPVFQNFCRGCAFELQDEIDWDAVDTLELVTGPAEATPADAGAPLGQPSGPNPFTFTALDLWQRLLREGHRITGVSGSDSKGNEPNDAEFTRKGYGSSATVVRAASLSRAGIAEGIRAGHVYIAALGRAGSPELRMTAVAPDGQTGIFGDTLRSATATVTVTVKGGAGQVLAVSRNGLPAGVVPITTDDFTHTFTAVHTPDSGPLGTFWRVDTLAAKSFTTIGNPIFLAP